MHAPAALRLVIVVSMLLMSANALALASGVVVVVGGDADRDTRQKLSAAVERGLRDHREERRQLDIAAGDVDALLSCVEREASKECASAFMRGAGAGASRAVVMRVARDARSKRAATATITGWVLAQDGTVLVIDQSVCDSCTAPMLEDVATSLVGDLLREVDARTTKTVLVVRSTPPGAHVEINGRLVGVTDPDLKHGVYPGTYRIVVQLRGHEDAIRTVSLVAGETKTVEVKLTPLAKAAPPHGATGQQPPTTRVEHQDGLRWGPWLTMGAGVVVGTAGIVYLVRDQGTPGTGDTWRYDRRDTATIGVATTAIGAVVVGAGVWWWLRDRAEADPPRTVTPAVGVGPGAVTFTLSGGF